MKKQKTAKTPPEPVHQPGTRGGEEVTAKEGKESGREDSAVNTAGRPTGKTDLTKNRNIGSEEPIDSDSPHIPAP